MKKRLLAAVLGSLFAASAWAIQPFVVKDIRVEGIQRTEAGTVFSYLPIRVGDTLDDEKAAAAIKALFGTGFFKDVRLEVENGVLVVVVEERPAIAQIDFLGMKEFEKDAVKKALKETGLAESRIFDKSLLDRAEQELKRQYLSRGKYGVSIATTVTPLERNRVGITFDVNEGDVAKIRQINIVGNKDFSEKNLLDLLVLRTPGWFTWYTKDDQYSKQKLAADLEALRSHYLNRGYLEFSIDSTQVSIDAEKKDIYITVNITEGSKFTVSEVKLGGELLVPEAELKPLIKIKRGEPFSREKLTESTKLIGERLGNDGYAFANVNAVPELNKEKREVAFTFFVDPGRKVYVRRIVITGNTRTRDEVIRREMRQMEGGWYAGDSIARSKQRVDRLGYFKDVNVETPAVAGTTDQVDMNVAVTEKPTGNLLLGAGFSSTDKLILSGSISQNNIFGSGKHLSVQLNTGKINTVYALSYTDPYYTIDGVSQGFDLFRRNVDPTSLSVGNYRTSTLGGTLRFGVPVTEDDTVLYSVGLENTKLTLFSDSPQRFIDFSNTFGNSVNTLLGTVGWSRDRRDSAIYPTRGVSQRAFGEAGLPGGDVKYYKLTYQHQWYYPLTRDLTALLNGEVGLGGGYSGKPLPFFKNFFAGGVSSVRGYDAASLGPRDSNDEALGGNRRFVGNAEVLMPFPGLRTDKSIRLSAFVDAGAIYGEGQQSEAEGFRYSAGLAVSWISPVGPLKFSFANPLNSRDGDRIQRFQFTLGQTF
ncbi:MAG: outer membrane protein assembly factor BamA [Betaproteobacteria bacterium]|nr:outer membrane protein assembly factor BamA [Betaproteobacteria bacterium]